MIFSHFLREAEVVIMVMVTVFVVADFRDVGGLLFLILAIKFVGFLIILLLSVITDLIRTFSQPLFINLLLLIRLICFK